MLIDIVTSTIGTLLALGVVGFAWWVWLKLNYEEIEQIGFDTEEE